MSRRARNCPDKRELARTVHSVDTDDLDMLMASAWADPEPEPEAITLKTGQRIDTRAEWTMPTDRGQVPR